ncbi:MAG: FAA hydrolase family protein [Gammaproteobacteria bacterium]|nr:MAG: FAA hydrolase family protein [Gammaproteobacteria bacterium]
MKFVSYTDQGQPGYGLVSDDTVHPVDPAFREQFGDLRSVLTGSALHRAEAAATGEPLALADVSLLPVIPNPGKIVGVGMNYSAHIAEMGRQPPAWPALFTRFPDSIVGHGQPIIRPQVSDHYDFEGELAVIIGRPARHVAAADAQRYIAGYSCFLDGSIRDYQRHTSQFIAGKNFRHSGAFGPMLVTPDEIPDLDAARLTTRVSGELMQQGHIGDLCIGIGRIIEYLSGIFRLEPGDVILTGTPSGVGAAREPQRWLEPGDVVEVSIDDLGTLRNEVADELR